MTEYHDTGRSGPSICAVNSRIDEHRVANSRRSGRIVERNHAAQPGTIVAQLDFRIMQIGNRGNQCQSKAVAGCRSAAREAIESAKYLVILAEGYSGTVVFDGGG